MKKQIISFCLIGTLAFGSTFYASADEISDLEAETANTQAQLDSINSSIDDLENQKAAILEQISSTDTQLVLTLATITTLNDQIAIMNEQISQTTKELESAEETEAVEYEAMKKRIQYLYEEGGDDGWATVLLEDNDISDYLSQAEYTQKIYDYDRECLEQYAATVEQVSNLKAEYETEMTNLQNMLTNQEEQQAYLEAQLNQMRATSDDYDTQLANATAAAASYVAVIEQQNAMINQLLAAQAAAQAAAEAAAAQAAAEAAAQAAAAQAAAQTGDDGSNAGGDTYTEPAYDTGAGDTGGTEYYDDGGDTGAVDTGVDTGADTGSEDASTPSYSYDDEVVTTGNAIVDRAYAWLGRAEYVWGGCSPGAFDCSGFVSYCVTGEYARLGTTYTFLTYPQVSDPQPGDICTSDHHCGIYIGGGMMIHCSDYGIGVIIGPVQSDMIIVRY